MTCKYCDFKNPKDGQKYTAGLYPVGKPLSYSEDGYIIMSHKNGCPANPDENKYQIEFDLFGVGIYTEINYCPKCGRKLGDTNE